jgi:MFS family permease
MLASGVFMAGALVCGAAVNRYMLLAGRVLLGFAIGWILENRGGPIVQVLPPWLFPSTLERGRRRISVER